LLAGYPELKKEDIQAALIYARASLEEGSSLLLTVSEDILQPGLLIPNSEFLVNDLYLA